LHLRKYELEKLAVMEFGTIILLIIYEIFYDDWGSIVFITILKVFEEEL
jgi:hypothetical protein